MTSAPRESNGEYTWAHYTHLYAIIRFNMLQFTIVLEPALEQGVCSITDSWSYLSSIWRSWWSPWRCQSLGSKAAFCKKVGAKLKEWSSQSLHDAPNGAGKQSEEHMGFKIFQNNRVIEPSSLSKDVSVKMSETFRDVCCLWGIKSGWRSGRTASKQCSQITLNRSQQNDAFVCGPWNCSKVTCWILLANQKFWNCKGPSA